MTILLLHDWEMVRDIVARLNSDNVSVLDDVSHATKLARSLARSESVALVDVDQYGIAVRGLSRHLPVIGLAVTSTNANNRALLNGALCVVLLGCKIRELREVVKKAKEGSLEAEEGKEIVVFAPTQRNVLGGIVEGLNAPQIADKLGLSAGYVRNVTRVLYEKAEVIGGGRFTARGKLVKWAMENGWGGGGI